MGETSMRPPIGWPWVKGNWWLVKQQWVSLLRLFPGSDLLWGERTQSKTSHYPLLRLSLLSQGLWFRSWSFTSETGTTHTAGLHYSLKHGFKRQALTCPTEGPSSLSSQELNHNKRVMHRLHDNWTCFIRKDFKTTLGSSLFQCYEAGSVIWAAL